MSASEEEDVDPLEGADIGETREVSHTLDLSVHGMLPLEFYGDDRELDVELGDVEWVDDPGNEEVHVTIDAELTKQLPRRWDYCQEPRTETEEQVGRRRKWLGRAARAAALVLPLGFSLWLAMQVMNAISGQITISGEPISAPTFGELAPVVVTVFVLSAVIMYGIKGGFPRKNGGLHR